MQTSTCASYPTESRYKHLSAGLPWFKLHDDFDAFNRLDLACVYALGPEKGRPLKVGWTGRPGKRYHNIQLGHWHQLAFHEIAWTQGPLVARRLEKEVHRLLHEGGRHLRGEWFDVTAELARPAFRIAASNIGVQTLSHTEMLKRFEDQIDIQILDDLRKYGVTGGPMEASRTCH